MAGLLSLVLAIAIQVLVMSRPYAGAAPADVVYYFTPMVDRTLYGYDRANNKSYSSSELPSIDRARQLGGLNAYAVHGREEVNLGDFKGTWISNASLCRNFTVSFFLKADLDMPERETLRLLDSGDPLRTNYGLTFTVTRSSNQNPRINGEVGDGSTIGEGVLVPANTSSWLHVALFTFPGTNGSITDKLFLNGKWSLDRIMFSSWKNYHGDFPTALMLGSSSNWRGFNIAYLRLSGQGLDTDRAAELYQESLRQAQRNFSVAIKFAMSSVTVRSDVGSAKISVERSGDLDIPAMVGFYTSEGSAFEFGLYQPVRDGRLIFKPGEVYKDVEIEIIKTDQKVVNKTFSVTLNKIAVYAQVQLDLETRNQTHVIIDQPESPTSGAMALTGHPAAVQLLLYLALVATLSLF